MTDDVELPEETPTTPETPAALSGVRSIVRPLSPGMRGFDCLSPQTAETYRCFRQAGYEFVGRYLHNLSLGEVSAALAAGLGLFGIRYAHNPGWEPTGELGSQDGAAAVQRARALGIAPGTALVCDLEGCKPGTTAQDAIGYLTRFAAAVVAAGYEACLYVGFACVLTGPQLAAIPGFRHYWRSCSDVPEPTCGFGMLQCRPGNLTVLGSLVDVDFVENDKHSPPRTMPAMWAA